MGQPNYKHYCQAMVNYCSQEIRAVHWHYTARFMVGDKTVDALSITQMTNLRDYEKDFTDHITMKCLIWRDEFTQHINPNREKLEVVITKEEKHESYELDLANPRRIAKKYRAIVLKQTDPDISSSQSGTPQNAQPIDASRRQMELELQLIDIGAEKLSKSTFGGIIGDSEIKEAIQYFMGESGRLNDLEAGLAIRGVDVVDPDVKQRQAQIVIPHGTKVLAIPELLQKDWGGVYNTSIGCYVTNNLIYVYPLYDLSRFHKETKKATIVVVPRTMLGNSKRTYVTNNGEMIVLVGAEIELDDTTNAKQANKGNGQTVFDSARMFNAPTTGETGKVVPEIGEAMSTYITKQRKDGLDFAPFADKQYTSNMAEVISKNSKDMGRVMTALWEWSFPDLITPMMPCRVVYFKADIKHELYGVIMKHQSVTQLDGGVGQKRHQTTTGLVLYVQREPTAKEKEEDEKNSKFVKTDALFASLKSLFS